MASISQIDSNPFKYSDSNKRYHTYNYYLKKRFGKKCAKIPLDGGFTCPNIDGTCGHGGCIYCSGGSSWGQSRGVAPLLEQYIIGTKLMREKWDTDCFIPYLQSYTNTHTSPQILEKMLDHVSKFDGAVMLDVATRADCLSSDIISVLDKVSKVIPLTVELGLQTANDKTAEFINRCHTYKQFEDGFFRLRQGAPNVKIGIHIINGLPCEDGEDMKNTAIRVANLHPDLVKIHLLHVLKDTPLAELYNSGKYIPMERDDYINIVCDQLEILPADIVIERVTGDGLESELIAPLWSKKKVTIINDIDKELVKRDSYQGKYWRKN